MPCCRGIQLACSSRQTQLHQTGEILVTSYMARICFLSSWHYSGSQLLHSTLLPDTQGSCHCSAYRYKSRTSRNNFRACHLFVFTLLPKSFLLSSEHHICATTIKGLLNLHLPSVPEKPLPVQRPSLPSPSYLPQAP